MKLLCEARAPALLLTMGSYLTTTALSLLSIRRLWSLALIGHRFRLCIGRLEQKVTGKPQSKHAACQSVSLIRGGRALAVMRALLISFRRVLVG